MSEDESRAVFEHLLPHIYPAFDFREESDVYEQLAISLDGDLLTEVYLQPTFRSFNCNLEDR